MTILGYARVSTDGQTLDAQVAALKARREAGEALTEIGRSYHVSHSTISRLLGAPIDDDHLFQLMATTRSN